VTQHRQRFESTLLADCEIESMAKVLGRNPTITEMAIYLIVWSADYYYWHLPPGPNGIRASMRRESDAPPLLARNSEVFGEFLNHLDWRDMTVVELTSEDWFLGQTRSFRAGRPISWHPDPSVSLSYQIEDVFYQATKRQRYNQNPRYARTILFHLVGASLDMVSRDSTLSHDSISSVDAVDHDADFVIGDAALHCTESSSEALIRKCGRNLSAGLRPIVITVGPSVIVAEELAKTAGIVDRFDVLDATQFLTRSIHEHGAFVAKNSRDKARSLVHRYNEIIASCETDPSLRIEMADGRSSHS